MNSSSFPSSCVCHIFLGVLLECSVWMQKANDLPHSKLSHFKIRRNIADVRAVSVYLNNTSVLCPRRPYTASVAIRCYPRKIRAHLSIRCCICTGSVLPSYCLRQFWLMQTKFCTVSVLSTPDFVRTLSAPIRSIRT